MRYAYAALLAVAIVALYDHWTRPAPQPRAPRIAVACDCGKVAVYVPADNRWFVERDRFAEHTPTGCTDGGKLLPHHASTLTLNTFTSATP